MGLLIILLPLFILLSGCTLIPQDNSTKILTVMPDNITIKAHVAQTTEELRQGLMYRTYLAENEGMLFVFEEERHLSFWMANTVLPLDIIFLDENKTIVDIQQMDPCNVRDTSTCPHYVSSQPAMYALEVTQNFTKTMTYKSRAKLSGNDYFFI
ncbi:MAG: DUF192 domain-containing protein [Candidatus Micrarchaeota archaeon]